MPGAWASWGAVGGGGPGGCVSLCSLGPSGVEYPLLHHIPCCTVHTSLLSFSADNYGKFLLP